jgi:integrase
VSAVAGIERQPMRRSGDFGVLSDEEVAALTRHTANEIDGAIFTTPAFSGLRLGELRALRQRDVDFIKRIIPSAGRTRWGSRTSRSPARVRAVPMIDQVARVLDELSRWS